MTIQPYEPGSQVAMGRELGKALVAKWVAEGKQAAATGDTSALWNSVQWAAYHSATVETATSLFTGDPAVARWASEGAPTCGATWEDEPASYCAECQAPIIGEVNVSEDGFFYCDDCW